MADDDWKPVGEAAGACGVPVRTAYNWLKSRRVESKVVGGVTMVSATAFASWADRRAGRATSTAPDNPSPRPAAPAGAGASAGTSVSNHAALARPTPRSPSLDGPVAAQLFEAFERGETPASLVRTLQIAPQEASAAWRSWEELRALAGNRASLQAQLDDLTQTIAGLSLKIDDYTSGGRLAGEVHILRRRLEDLQKAFEALPVPRREEFACHCGTRGHLAFHVRCAACGGEYYAGHNGT